MLMHNVEIYTINLLNPSVFITQIQLLPCVQGHYVKLDYLYEQICVDFELFF